MRAVQVFLLTIGAATFLPAAAEVSAKDWFVSQTGDNSTGESWESAYLSIGRALSEADPGDAVHVAAGVYIESVTVPVGVSLIGGHSSYSSGSVVHNRNPRIYTTTIGATEEFTTIRLLPSSVLDGFDVFGRLFQFNVNQSVSNESTIRTCRIVYEHPEIIHPVIGTFPSALLIMEECFVRFMTEQPVECLVVGGRCRIVNTIFSYDLPLETFPIVLAGVNFRFVNCVFYDRGEFERPNTLAPTVGGIILDVYNSISNQHIAVTSGGPFANRVTNSIVPFPPAFGGSFPADPQFIDPDNDDFRVHPTSPTIDRGGVVVGWTTLHDFEGRPRVVDIPGVGRTGTSAIDIGAYEMQLDEYRFRSDFNGDGVVDALDLLIFSRDWHRGTGP